MHPYARPRDPRNVGDNWERRLSRPVAVTPGRTVRSLADVRGQILAMTPERQNSPAWRNVARHLMLAAQTEGGDVEQLTIAVEMALRLEDRLARAVPADEPRVP